MSKGEARGRGSCSASGQTAGRLNGSRGRGNGYRGSYSRKTPSCWWADLTGVCPISLVPVAELDCAPFALCAETPSQSRSRGRGVLHYFDARFLAHWMVSSGDLSDPMNRRPLTREECLALDEHMQSFHPEMNTVSVTDAFDFQARLHTQSENDSSASSAGHSLQREANLVLQSLFQWRRSESNSQGSRDSAGHRVVYSESGLRVVDDDDIEATEAAQAFTNQDVAFPALSNEQWISSVERPQWPAPVSTAAPAVSTSVERAHEHNTCELQSKPRPRLQLKKRSEDLGPVGSNVCESSQRSSVFGSGRPRDKEPLEGELSAEGNTPSLPKQCLVSLCVYSRCALVHVAHDQQLRVRWLARVESEMQRLINNTSSRDLELEASSHIHCFLIREVSFHCCLDVDMIGNASETLQKMRVAKTGTSRAPLMWLSEAATTFAHYVLPLQEDLPSLRSRLSHSTVLMTYCGPPGKGKGLEAALHEACQVADHDEPHWLMGGRHVLVRFARRCNAQKCCSRLSPGSRKSGLWVAQCWSGDAEWASWQLQQLAKAGITEKVATTKLVDVGETPVAELAVAAPSVRAVAVIGGKWGALLEDEQGSDDSDTESDASKEA